MGMKDNEPLQWIGKLFELQRLTSRKAELALQVAERFALNLSSDRGRDLSLHNRERHGGHFDTENDLKYQREYSDELTELRKEYTKVCEQIKKLQTEVQEGLYEPVGA